MALWLTGKPLAEVASMAALASPFQARDMEVSAAMGGEEVPPVITEEMVALAEEAGAARVTMVEREALEVAAGQAPALKLLMEGLAAAMHMMTSPRVEAAWALAGPSSSKKA